MTVFPVALSHRPSAISQHPNDLLLILDEVYLYAIISCELLVSALCLVAPSFLLFLFPGSHAANSVFHSPYTLPSSVSRKSCICHSYENTGGVGVFFPFWNEFAPPSTPVSGSLPSPEPGPRYAAIPLFSYCCALFCGFLHSFALSKNSTLFFSIISTLFVKKRGVGAGRNTHSGAVRLFPYFVTSLPRCC